MDRLLQEAAMLTLEAKSAALPDIRDGIARLVRQALQVDWAYAGAYRAWREATVGDRELRALHQQIEAWTAQQLNLLFRVLLLVPGARQGVDSETLAWELALLLLRLFVSSFNVTATLVFRLLDSIFTHFLSYNKIEDTKTPF